MQYLSNRTTSKMYCIFLKAGRYVAEIHILEQMLFSKSLSLEFMSLYISFFYFLTMNSYKFIFNNLLLTYVSKGYIMISKGNLH